MAISGDDEIVRALHFPYWNGTRATPSAFKNPNTSVSSLAILSYDEIIEIFRHDLETVKTPPLIVQATATLKVADLLKVCEVAATQTKVSIVEDPIINDPPYKDNPSHCIVKGRDRSDETKERDLTAGMGNAILAISKIRLVAPPDNNLGGELQDLSS